jgi:large subunit ribosomal protein L25
MKGVITMFRRKPLRIVSSSTQLHWKGVRHFSTLDDEDNPLKNPSKYVEDLTVEDVERDEEIKAFLIANFSPNKNAKPVYRRKDKMSTDASNVDDSIMDSRNIRQLTCYLRDPEKEDGSRYCRRLRDNFLRIPGILYGDDPTQNISARDLSSRIWVQTPWNLLQREWDRYHINIASRVYDLKILRDDSDLEGSVHRVLPVSVQRHPIQNKLYCVNYIRYHPMRTISIPIMYINEEDSPALKRGGYIAPVKRHVRCIVEDGVPIPEHLELECSGLENKNVIRLDRIQFPDGVSISKDVVPEKFIIGTVFGRRSDPKEAEKT